MADEYPCFYDAGSEHRIPVTVIVRDGLRIDGYMSAETPPSEVTYEGVRYLRTGGSHAVGLDGERYTFIAG